MSKVIRIGTRDSELALWQANTVKRQLESLGYQSVLVPVKSTGDLVLDKPLYELGITGIFTKTLDIAMLNHTIDIAVHSMKDVPTTLPKGICKAAVLPRANTADILVQNPDTPIGKTGVIATGSLRRKAQWLHKYPDYTTVDLRGNVNTRMQKLQQSSWTGAIFAKAGLERIALKHESHTVLDWMIPAPAQGAMLVVAMQEDTFTKEVLAKLNDSATDICTQIERDFLQKLEGGCTAPIGALATIEGDTIHFTGALFSLDGKQKRSIQKSIAIKDSTDFGFLCAQELLENGAAALMQQIKQALA